jgi:hypothetical protein
MLQMHIEEEPESSAFSASRYGKHASNADRRVPKSSVFSASRYGKSASNAEREGILFEVFI